MKRALSMINEVFSKPIRKVNSKKVIFVPVETDISLKERSGSPPDIEDNEFEDFLLPVEPENLKDAAFVLCQI